MKSLALLILFFTLNVYSVDFTVKLGEKGTLKII